MSCKEFLKYEQNPLFRYLSSRLKIQVAVAIQAAAEAGLAVAAGTAFNPSLPLTPIGIISLVFALAHLMAWRSNRRFLADLYGKSEKM